MGRAKAGETLKVIISGDDSLSGAGLRPLKGRISGYEKKSVPKDSGAKLLLVAANL